MTHAGKYQTEALTHRPSDSEFDMPKLKFDIERLRLVSCVVAKKQLFPNLRDNIQSESEVRSAVN